MPAPKADVKPLTRSQLAVLLQTPYVQMRTVFRGYPREFLNEERKRARKVLPKAQLIDLDAHRHREESEKREREEVYRAAIRERDHLRRQLAALAGAPDVVPREVRIAQRRQSQREATAIVLASDWHCEERVTREATNGLNEFDLAIFKDRARWFFANTAKLLHKEQRDIRIPHMILAVLGDMLSGSIHRDLAESNHLGLMDAVALAQDTIAGGIRYLLAETDVRLTVVWKVGNHSRVTHEQRVQTEQAVSLEWLVGHSLAQFFADEPRVTFVRDRSLLTYVDVYGRAIRFTHGHAFKYAGGVGGLTIPVNKKIAEWDKGRQAHLTCFGHLHTYMRGQRFVSNGSLIGYGPYSVWIGAAFEPPMQAFTLIDSRFGRTVEAPVLLEQA